MHKDKKASMLEASMNKFLNGGECANLHLLNLLTIDLCLKVSYWALCPPPLCYHGKWPSYLLLTLEMYF